jgi:putative ABC transport system ATP-binding protein
MTEPIQLPAWPRDLRPRNESDGHGGGLAAAMPHPQDWRNTMNPTTETKRMAAEAMQTGRGATPFTIADIDRVLATVTGRPQAPHERVVGDAAVRARGLAKRYGRGGAAVDALRGASIDLERGKLTAVMGPSGSGKSTLMHILAGLDQPTSGTVEIDGIEITRLKERDLTKLRRDRVGFIFQSFNLLPMLSAAENLTLPLTIAGRRPDRGWLGALVERVGLGDRLEHRPSELSGGQQQRVAVARALVSRPAVLFADEPTGNLDSRTGQEVLDLLRRSVDEFGQTIVMVTHDPGAATIADRVLFLKDGEIVLDRDRMSRDEIFDTIKGLEHSNGNQAVTS